MVAYRYIENPKSQILLSAASAWEIAIKYSLGKLKLPEKPDQYVLNRLARDRISSLEIHALHVLQIASLPPIHRDPFDRILVVQAQMEKIPILTADETFKKYDVEVIWAG